MVCQGIIDGNNGTDGYNMVSVPMYRRSATALTNSDRPTGTLTYSFSTGKLSGAASYFNSWTQSIPAVVAGTKLYVIMAVARSQSNTDDIASTEWSTPVEYVSDGMNSAPVLIYKRDASVSDKPSDGAVYNFKTGALTGTLNGWSTSIPATDSNHNPCWVRHAMAVGIGETDTIDASEWGDATKLVEDGASITKKSETYRYAIASQGTNPSSITSWSTSRPTSWSKNTFLWTETTITWSDNSTTVLYQAERNPNDGVAGMSVSIKSQNIDYAKSTVKTDPSTLTYGSYPSSLSKGDWLYTRTTVNYQNVAADGTTTDAGSTVSYSASYIGTDGQTITGRGISSITEHYKASSSDSGESTPTNGTDWGTTPTPSNWNSTNKYIWNYEKITYTDNTVSRTPAGVIAIYSQDGKSLDSITDYYLATTKSSGVTKDGDSGWSTSVQSISSNKPYLWNYEKLHWILKDGTTTDTYTSPQMIGHWGKDGDDAVTYRISLAGSRFSYNPNTGLMYVNITGKVFKIVGGTTSVYTGLERSELKMYYVDKDDNMDYVPDVVSVDSGYTVNNGTFASKYYNECGYSDELVFVVSLKINNVEVARESIQVEIYGESIKGDPGRMYYMAGKFPNKAPYSRTDDLCPIVYHGGSWWYLKESSATSSDTPSDSSDKWGKVDDFDVVLTDAIFVKEFAQFCSAIITKDWLISVHGTINGTAYEGSVESPVSVEQGGLEQVTYAWFDSDNPNKSVQKNRTYGETTVNCYNFIPNYAVDLKTGATYQHDGYFEGEIHVQSQNRGSWTISPDVYGVIPSPNIVGKDKDGNEVLSIGFMGVSDEETSWDIVRGGGMMFNWPDVTFGFQRSHFCKEGWRVNCEDFGENIPGTTTPRETYIESDPYMSNPHLYFYDNYTKTGYGLSVGVDTHGVSISGTKWPTYSESSSGGVYVNDFGNLAVKGKAIQKFVLVTDQYELTDLPEGSMIFVKGASSAAVVKSRIPIMNSHNNDMWSKAIGDSNYYAGYVYGTSHIFIKSTYNNAACWIDFYCAAYTE